MVLLPFQRINIQSGRSADELIDALARVTRKPDPISFRPRFLPKETATFIGEASKQRLHIRPAINYRNSFAPLIIGKIVDTPLGARIEAVMRPHVAVLVFVALFAFFLAPAVIISVMEYIERGMFSEFGWVPLAMFAGLYAMCMVGFLSQARRMKKNLRDITGPEIATRQLR